MDASDDEIADDVLPVAVEEIAVPTELNELAPWHRPRKQFIRRDQWGMLSDRVINNLKNTPHLPQQANGVREVKYLTLPGTDFIDVEMLGEIAREHDCTLTSVGFLAGTVGNAATARAELRQEGLIEAGLISDRSLTFSRRIEEITTKSGTAYRELKNRGPYHVINIDACGSIALPGAPNNNRLIKVVHTLMEYQFAHYRGRWLFFLTSDVRQGQFDADTMARLRLAIRQNAQQNDDFRNGTTALFDNGIADYDASLDAFAHSSADNFTKVFALGFGKWMLSLAREEGWDMKMQPAYCYSTTPNGDNAATMPCLAFEFLPPPPVLNDPLGIVAEPTAPIVQPQYGERAVRVLEKVSGMQNLDERLAANDVERAELLNATRERLARIGYPAEVLQNLA